MLVVNNLQLRRGKKTCVDGVNVTFKSGQLTALIGPNGAGKSSLIKAISGEWPTAQGDVSIFGKPAAMWSAKE